MYCRYCGKKLKDDAAICTGCRRPVGPIAAGGNDDAKGPTWSFPMMAGLILATLPLPPIGFIFGWIGRRSETKKAQGAVLLTVATFATLFWLAIILGL
jgi:hypothetical protein